MLSPGSTRPHAPPAKDGRHAPTPASGHALAILTYHSLDTGGSVSSVAPREFARQIRCIADSGLRGISLRDAVTYRDAHHVWPAHCVVLTFDDGYANMHEHALPVLAGAGFRATVFVVSRHVGGRNDWGPAPGGLGMQSMLSWTQLTDLAAAGVEIGAHTRTHPDLTRCSVAQAREEIVGSRLDLERRLGAPVHSFAYPFGRASALSLALVGRAFQAACTTELRRARDEAAHVLPRIDAYYLRSPDHLERLLDGGLDRYLAIRRWGRRARRMLVPDGGPRRETPSQLGHGRNTPLGRESERS